MPSLSLSMKVLIGGLYSERMTQWTPLHMTDYESMRTTLRPMVSEWISTRLLWLLHVSSSVGHKFPVWCFRRRGGMTVHDRKHITMYILRCLRYAKVGENVAVTRGRSKKLPKGSRMAKHHFLPSGTFHEDA
jgi:hypothetical protein